MNLSLEGVFLVILGPGYKSDHIKSWADNVVLSGPATGGHQGYSQKCWGWACCTEEPHSREEYDPALCTLSVTSSLPIQSKHVMHQHSFLSLPSSSQNCTSKCHSSLREMPLDMTLTTVQFTFFLETDGNQRPPQARMVQKVWKPQEILTMDQFISYSLELSCPQAPFTSLRCCLPICCPLPSLLQVSAGRE